MVVGENALVANVKPRSRGHSRRIHLPWPKNVELGKVVRDVNDATEWELSDLRPKFHR